MIITGLDMSTATHPWVGLRLSDMLDRSTKQWPDNVAVLDGGREITYEELRALSITAAANMVADGVREGDRVAILLGERWEYAALVYAVTRIGAVVVPFSMVWEAAEVEEGIRLSGATYIIAQTEYRGRDVGGRLDFLGCADGTPPDDEYRHVKRVVREGGAVAEGVPSLASLFRESMAPFSNTVVNELAYIMFTSGSSASPKAALIAHAGALGGAHYVGQRFETSGDDRLLNISPFHHCGGHVLGMLHMHMFGAAVRLIQGFQIDVVMDSMWRDQSSILIGFDVVNMRIIERGLEERGALPFKKILTGPGVTVFDQLTDLGLDVIIVYGATELSNFGAINRASDEHRFRKEANGFPLPGVTIKIVDPADSRTLPPHEIGEISVSGWNITPGYLRADGQVHPVVDSQGFYHSGDLGFMDEDGRIYYRGRYSAMVKTGGENVSQAEVETYLVTNIEEIVQAAVVGVPDPKWGEAVVAFVQTADGRPIPEETLRDRCRGGLAGYKIPKRFLFVSPGEWPINATGKIVKPDLIDRASG